MKKIKLTFALLAAAVMGLSCAPDYLDTYPENYERMEVIFETVDNAEMAINGMCRLLCTPYSSGGQNGEGAIMYYYGNMPGNDFQKANRTGMSTYTNQAFHSLIDNGYVVFPWFYYYKLINNANFILENIDGAEGAEKDKEYVKAQALTFRAYSFFRLSELYCHRWMDNPAGTDRGLPLRLTTSCDTMPCSSMGDVYKQIYKDLDGAIAYFNSCGRDRKKNEYYKPNINVAYAIYARAALTREDWENAVKYAQLAREGYPLMSNEEYLEGGFNTVNQEWIWGWHDSLEENGTTTMTWGNYMASNSGSTNSLLYPSAISKELYDRIPSTDVRKKCYLEPKSSELTTGYYTKTGESVGPLADRARAQYGSKLFDDGTTRSAIYVYMQFKFQCIQLPGVASMCMFRSAEMYYTEAEALWMLGNHEDEIRALLNEVVKPRDPSYNCAVSGAKLLDEIKLYRRFDLWGEGHDWYDYKRWGATISRKSLAKGGSFHATFAGTFPPDKYNKWTLAIPRKETDYNPAIGPADGDYDFGGGDDD